MKNISVITTGGTIGSILGNDSVGVDPAEKRIAYEISKAKEKLGCSVTVSSPINKNSENFSPADWLVMLNEIKKANDSHSDGIVITHGSDTLVYSVAAALAFGNLWDKKICFTGAYYAPNHPSSDTTINLLAALEFARSTELKSGVYVAFRANQHNSEANIIHGSTIKPMDFDSLVFDSAYTKKVATFSPKEGILNYSSLSDVNSPCLDAAYLPNKEDVRSVISKVGMITLYPGIDRKMLDAAAEGRDILIVEGYHCGTGPSDAANDLIRFIEDVRGKTKILFGTFPERYIDIPYESTLKLSAAGASIYFDLQVHFLYVFSVLGLSLSLTSDEIVAKMRQKEIGQEM